jgi:hypothetical protein
MKYNKSIEPIRNNQYINDYSTTSSPIYSTDLNESKKKLNYIVKSILSGQFKYDYEKGIYDSLPLFLNTNYISVPSELKRHLERNKSLLNKIDSDTIIAIEKCLLVASNLTNDKKYDEWKSLCSEILQIQVKKGNDNTYFVRNIVDVLLQTGFVEIKKDNHGYDIFTEGKCRDFKLTNTSIKYYKLTTKQVIYNRQKAIIFHLRKIAENIIVNNLLRLYPRLTFPSLESLNQKAKKLVKEKYSNRKGQVLKFRNKHPDSYFKEIEQIVFVEDHLSMYDRYVTKCLRIPTIGDNKSGGRVVDSLVLIPKWIREEILIDGERIIECDYQCLHPNIAFSIYGGDCKFLTHQIVSDYLGIDVKIIKKGHLKFFNQRAEYMQKNPVFKYYEDNHIGLLVKFAEEKLKRRNHKITSKKLFGKEVELMSKVIKKLNRANIYGIYVYDALYVKQSDSEKVKDIMNEVALTLGIYTTA